MSISFLTPEGMLVALLAALPLTAAALVARRADRVRALLGLAPPRRRGDVWLVAASAAVAAALGLACAQPVATREDTRRVRSDAEALVVVDVSRSMLAARGPLEATRLQRARRAALRLRTELADVPVGLVSLSDRVLPHVFPTADAEVFARAAAHSVGVGRPGPQSVGLRATAFGVLGALATDGYFRDGIGRRLAIVLTDGETLPVDGDALRGALAEVAPVELVFVRFNDLDERIYGADGAPEEAYRPDPAAGASLDRFAVALGAEVFPAADLAAATRRAREVVGEGPTRDEERLVQEVSLAPYAALGSALPLLFVLFRRNRA